MEKSFCGKRLKNDYDHLQHPRRLDIGIAERLPADERRGLQPAFGQRKQLAPPVKDHLDAPHGQRPFGYRCKRIVAQHPIMPDIRNECRCGLYDSE